MAKRRRTQLTATCVRRVHSEPELTWTHYRITGQGLREMSVDHERYHKDVVVSASTRWVKHGEKPEVMLIAANKSGKPKRNERGALIQLWGGGRGDLSATKALKDAGATKVVTCAQVQRGPLDQRRRRKSR